MLPHWDGQYIHIKSQRPADQEPVRMHCTVTRTSHDSGALIRIQPILRSPQLPGPLMGSWHPVWVAQIQEPRSSSKSVPTRNLVGGVTAFSQSRWTEVLGMNMLGSGVHGCSWLHLDHVGSWFSLCRPQASQNHPWSPRGCGGLTLGGHSLTSP